SDSKGGNFVFVLLSSVIIEIHFKSFEFVLLIKVLKYKKMDKMHETLRDFAKHYTDYIPEIPVLQHVPSACEFFSHYVIPNKPFAISCPENHLPAVSRWKKTFYLEDKLFYMWPTTCVIPIHRPYPIVYERFMEPEIRKMQCYDILLEMERKWQRTEYYYVKQPNNLEEFSPIADDIRADVPWATEALGKGPIAANLSMGNADNFTTLHKDEYDNFFYVLRGSREFKLIPPIARFCIPSKRYKKFQWVKSKTEDEFEAKDLNEEIDFIPSEIVPETLEKNGFYRNIKSYVVKIQPGEALYIPAHWYHEYHQSDDCFTLKPSVRTKDFDYDGV
ncbi:unnamed protein product, partial [Larinioides sclopetarius]